MTPEQRTALEGARAGDLILITSPAATRPPPPPPSSSSSTTTTTTTGPDLNPPSSPSQPERVRLLLIHTLHPTAPPSHHHPTIHILSTESLQASDWLTYLRRTTAFTRNFPQDQNHQNHHRNHYHQHPPLPPPPPPHHQGEEPHATTTNLEEILSDSDQIVLRPSFGDLFRTMFYGTCPWLDCLEGLVLVSNTSTSGGGGNSSTRTVLRDFGGMMRRFGSGLEYGMRTLCPFCMGIALYRDHEILVERQTNLAWPEFRYDIAARDEHIGRINARRSELGYTPVDLDTALGDLRPEGEDVRSMVFGATISDLRRLNEPQADAGAVRTSTDRGGEDGGVGRLARPWDADTVSRTPPAQRSAELTAVTADALPNAEAGPSTSRHPSSALRGLPFRPNLAPEQESGPVLPHLRSREWYVKAAVRVLIEKCPICLEEIKVGEVVADLPCWHFFHAECWSRVEGDRCPFRCNEGSVHREDDGNTGDGNGDGEDGRMDVEEIE